MNNNLNETQNIVDPNKNLDKTYKESKIDKAGIKLLGLDFFENLFLHINHIKGHLILDSNFIGHIIPYVDIYFLNKYFDFCDNYIQEDIISNAEILKEVIKDNNKYDKLFNFLLYYLEDKSKQNLIDRLFRNLDKESLKLIITFTKNINKNLKYKDIIESFVSNFYRFSTIEEIDFLKDYLEYCVNNNKLKSKEFLSGVFSAVADHIVNDNDIKVYAFKSLYDICNPTKYSIQRVFYTINDIKYIEELYFNKKFKIRDALIKEEYNNYLGECIEVIDENGKLTHKPKIVIPNFYKLNKKNKDKYVISEKIVNDLIRYVIKYYLGVSDDNDLKTKSVKELFNNSKKISIGATNIYECIKSGRISSDEDSTEKVWYAKFNKSPEEIHNELNNSVFCKSNIIDPNFSLSFAYKELTKNLNNIKLDDDLAKILLSICCNKDEVSMPYAFSFIRKFRTRKADIINSFSFSEKLISEIIENDELFDTVFKNGYWYYNNDEFYKNLFDLYSDKELANSSKYSNLRDSARTAYYKIKGPKYNFDLIYTFIRKQKIPENLVEKYLNKFLSIDPVMLWDFNFYTSDIYLGEQSALSVLKQEMFRTQKIPDTLADEAIVNMDTSLIQRLAVNNRINKSKKNVCRILSKENGQI